MALKINTKLIASITGGFIVEAKLITKVEAREAFRDFVSSTFYESIKRFDVADVDYDKYKLEMAIKSLTKDLSKDTYKYEEHAARAFEIAMHTFLIAHIGPKTPAHNASLWFAKQLVK